MRLVSYDLLIDIPYVNSYIYIEECSPINGYSYRICAHVINDHACLAYYSTEEDAKHELMKCRDAYKKDAKTFWFKGDMPTAIKKKEEV